jgi:dienelactone hydrolase
MHHRMSRRQALGALGALALPLELLGRTRQSASPSPDAAPAWDARVDGASGSPPDLGNLYGTVEWIAREHSPALSFLDPRWRSLEAWKEEARRAVHRYHSFDPAPGPVRAQVTHREDRRGFRVETVRIQAAPAYDIPAQVLVPTRRRGRLPAVIALHCHGGQYRWGYGKLVSNPDDPPVLVGYRDTLYGRPYAEHLARRGFVVIAIDAFYFGERRLRPQTLDPAAAPAEAREHFRALDSHPEDSRDRVAALNRIAGAYETVMAKTLFAAGATWPGLLAWDDRRTVDYLASRPDVDPERIGCVGFSGGGLRAAHLVASDTRLRAACIVAWMSEFAPMLPHHVRRHTWMAYTPGMYRSLDLPDMAALLAPGALLVQQCRRDTLFPLAGMQGAVAKLERIYARAGIPDRFFGAFYDEPHAFRPHMQEEAFAWLERWL